MSILAILNDLAATTSRKEKEYILKEHKDNALLKVVFWAAYNPDLTYWIQKTPAYNNTSVAMDLQTAIGRLLTRVATRGVTGNAAIEFYQALLCSLTADDAEVLKRIVNRDLRCGVNIPTINKIWKGAIPTYELMLAETDPKRLVFPCYVQLKMDGLRCLITRTLNDEIILRTRNGNQITSLEVMYDQLRQVIKLGETWDGELVCYQDGVPMNRKVSNGILNKAIRNTISPQEANLVVFVVWDIVDQTQSIPYKARFAQLSAALVNHANKVIPVQNWRADNLARVEQLFEEALQGGHEGVIAKNIDAVWQPKRTFDLVKFKAEKTVDLLVVGWEEGTGKNAGRTGALVCETSDGLVRVNVGTGFSDPERIEFAINRPIDSIVEVLYNARITKKGGGVDSLYLPRFVKIRDDKSEASSSKEVK